MEYHEVTARSSNQLRFAYYQNILNNDGAVSSETDTLFEHLLNNAFDDGDWCAWIALHNGNVVSACLLRSVFIAPTANNNSGMISFLAPLFSDEFDAKLLELAISRAKEMGIAKLHIVADDKQCGKMVDNGVKLSNGLMLLSVV